MPSPSHPHELLLEVLVVVDVLDDELELVDVLVELVELVDDDVLVDVVVLVELDVVVDDEVEVEDVLDEVLELVDGDVELELLDDELDELVECVLKHTRAVMEEVVGAESRCEVSASARSI